MDRRLFVASAAAIAASISCRALSGNSGLDPNWFLNDAEYALELKRRGERLRSGLTRGDAYDRSVLKSAAGGPKIVVRQPDVSQPVVSPVKLDIEFVPPKDAVIDLSSLRVTYGTLGLDVTDRIRKFAEVSITGIRAEIPKLPKGRHSFEIYIADSLKRVGKHRVRCEVAG